MSLINDEISYEIIQTAKRLSNDKSIDKITVRDILKKLNLTNRVFYNRFHNIDEVFEILYKESVDKVRESLSIEWDRKTDFGEHIKRVATRTLILTYESRQNMSQFIFEADSVSNTNYEWWMREINELILLGQDIGYIQKNIDSDAVCYSIWCFIRGFNADALARNLPKKEAIRQFEYGFGCLIKGIMVWCYTPAKTGEKI